MVCIESFRKYMEDNPAIRKIPKKTDPYMSMTLLLYYTNDRSPPKPPHSETITISRAITNHDASNRH
jgi:hypothetical protein